MADKADEDLDRAAILARRRKFIAQAMAGIERSALVGPKNKLMALAVSGLTTACPRPCLNDIGSTNEPEDTETGETGETSEPTGTGTGETGS